MNTNAGYKNSLFSRLFSEPDILRELYGALEGITLEDDIPITLNTLEDVLFMNRINDISFEIGGKLVVLIEHQSTVNPNICLRMLLYVARIYEKITGEGKENIYGTRQISVPRPEFFVLYNGEADYPDRKTLCLSAMFADAGLLLSAKRKPPLELTVQVFNINAGRNEEITARSITLEGYGVFVQKVREYKKEYGSLEEGLPRAVRYCIDHGILQGFLEKHGSEVANMLTKEWNMDDALDVRFREGRNEGKEETARNALAKGIPLETVRDITGLDEDVIKRLLPR